MADPPERSRRRARPLGTAHIGLPVAALCLALLPPSLSMALQLGSWAVPAYLVAATVWIVVFVTWVAPLLLRLRPRPATLLAAGVLVALAAAVLVVHPMIDQTGFTFLGRSIGANDSDDAVRLGIAALLEGRHPYGDVTFLGQVLGPMPGAFVLGLPFYLAGDVALAGVAALAVFWLLAAQIRPAPQQATALLLLVLTASPLVGYELLTGMDRMVDVVAVLAFGTLCVRWSHRRPAWILAAAVGVGVAMATRANLMLLLLPLLAVVMSNAGWRRAAGVAAGAATGFLVVTLPVFLWDPDRFTPWHAGSEKLSGIPGGALVVPAVGALIAVGLWWLPHRDVWDFYRDCFVVQFAVVTIALVARYATGSPVAEEFFAYGSLFLYAGALFCWRQLQLRVESAQRTPKPGGDVSSISNGWGQGVRPARRKTRTIH